MNIEWFDETIKPQLDHYNFHYSKFPEGDFGDLERVDIEGFNVFANADFWSKGWISVEVFNLTTKEQVLIKLISPDENGDIDSLFKLFVDTIKSNK